MLSLVLKSKYKICMNSFRTCKNTRKWVLFALLAFMGQVVMADVHSNMMFSDTSSGSSTERASGSTCHGDRGHSIDDVAHTSQMASTVSSTAGECCDEGCTMMVCHSVSAILSSVRLETLRFHNPSFFFLSQAAVIKSVSSPYRPPIFG